ncbi:MAG: hydrogenase expression/formation protein HypE [Candidatus Omnitrophota bacterium]
MNKTITIGHGSGGRLTHGLIGGVFFKYLGNDILERCEDAALVNMGGGDIAFTTDSFVVKPAFFPGGDIGKLAVCGTVNDLAVTGARPMFITCGFIIEEGFLLEDLEIIVKSMGEWAGKAGVKVAAGDTKVVEKGEADGIFINTSGIGSFNGDVRLSVDRIKPGDKVIISGTVGDHGIAVLSRRKGLEFGGDVRSDCAPLNKMLSGLIESVGGVRFMRDPTRGGLATTLNEITGPGKFGITIEEKDIPVREEVRGACELLGLDPLYMANEGKAVIIADPSCAEDALSALKENEYGKGAAVIGEITPFDAGMVCLRTRYGVRRIIDMLTAEHLPRIC